MSLPATLSDLTPREAVKDALYRAVAAIDKGDKALFDSVLTRDTLFELSGREMKGLDAIHAQMFSHISTLDTTHSISNERVQIHESGNTASLSALALAQHYRAGEGMKPGSDRLLAGAQYDVELFKDIGSLWKITIWKIKLVWTEGDMAIVTPPS